MRGPQKVALLALALAVAGCGTLLGIEERPLGEPNDAAQLEAGVELGDAGVPDAISISDAETDSSVPLDDGAALGDSAPLQDDANADARATDCPTQLVTWTVGVRTCSVTSGGLMAPDASKKLTDSVPTDTGFVTVNCLGGVLVRSGAVCVTPQVVDVRGPTGCVNGYCTAAAGECGVADPNAATAICVAKGFAAQTTFTTMEGPDGANQCGATGGGCFVNANPTCNIVFETVTCRY